MAINHLTKPVVEPELLVSQLKLLLHDPESLGDDAQRQELKQLCRQAAEVLEAPFETVQRLAYSSLPLVTSRIAQEHSLFEALATAEEPVNLTSLVKNMVVEAEPGRFSAIKLTHLLTVPLFKMLSHTCKNCDSVTRREANLHSHDNFLPAFTAFNTVLSNPSKNLTAFKVGQHSEEDFYTWMETHPIQQGAFHRFMEAQFASLPIWLDVMDFETEIAKDISPTEVAFVNVGDGAGHQCGALKKMLPELNGRVILQDRPEVLEKALPIDGMEKVAYDFLTEQPVKDARVYYFRQIMHNFDDETCIKILRSQRSAIGPNSFIVIDDKVLPDIKPLPNMPGVEYTAALSLAMKIKSIRKFTKFDDAAIIAVKY